jgi:tRNA nucleotidyltransferase (CCA-adding enzyme)
MLFTLPENVSVIIGRLRDAGFEAYAVGGCVRDMLLKVTPKDWDITTSATPEQIKEIFKRTVDTGIKHGTVTVLVEDGAYEVTTYRIDGKYEDSRHPSDVTFTKSLKEDLLRRDFTINAMAYNEEQGFVDCFGGMEDLENGIIRCVGNPHERFNEDALRILRAFRFAARFGFEIEPDTREAAKELAWKLVNISAERIREELTKTLISRHPEELYEMYADGIVQVVLPEPAPFFEDETGAKDLLCDITRVLYNEELTEKDRVIYAWGVLLGAAAPVCEKDGVNAGAFTRAILNKLKFDNETISFAAGLAANTGLGPDPSEEAVRRLLSRMGDRLFDLWAKYICSKAGSQDDVLHEAALETVRTAEKIRERGDCVTLKMLAVNGKDLVSKGIHEGTAVGKCLGYLLDRVLAEPSLNTKEKLLELSGEFLANEEQP